MLLLTMLKQLIMKDVRANMDWWRFGKFFIWNSEILVLILKNLIDLKFYENFYCLITVNEINFMTSKTEFCRKNVVELQSLNILQYNLKFQSIQNSYFAPWKIINILSRNVHEPLHLQLLLCNPKFSYNMNSKK